MMMMKKKKKKKKERQRKIGMIGGEEKEGEEMSLLLRGLSGHLLLQEECLPFVMLRRYNF